MRPGLRTLAAALALASTALLGAAPAGGQIVVWEGEDAELGIGGYLRGLSAVSHLPYSVPGQEPTSGIHAQVLRLEWELRLGEAVVMEIHDRVQLQLTSAPSDRTLAGFGVSAVPGRAVDLRSDFIRQDRIRAWHDVDRLAVSLYTGLGDFTVGRQAVTWGVSSLFPVADLWSRFSPFELDTEDKPGIDAVRWLAYPGGGWELDGVLAHRGRWEDLSVGIRGSRALPWADVWVGAGKFWREAMVMGGIAAPLDSWKLRAEAVVPRGLDGNGWERPRVTLGVDRLSGETVVSAEYHYNGIGAAGVDGYAGVLEDPRFLRGETYHLGRHYLGTAVVWSPGNDRLSLSLSGIVNLHDPSSAWTPVVTYDLGQSVRVSVGGVLTTGTGPAFDGAPRLRSEYGSYGELGFTRVSLYF